MDSLGPRTPPDPAALSMAAAVVGLKATWTMGLIIGVAFLLANNPRADRPQLPYGCLFSRMVIVLISCVVLAVALGLAGVSGWLAHFSTDFSEMVRHDEFRPYRFMAVYGIHLGGYAGGALGTLLAVLSIRRGRAKLPDEPHE